jgi:chromosome segregation ATPase
VTGLVAWLAEHGTTLVAIGAALRSLARSRELAAQTEQIRQSAAAAAVDAVTEEMRGLRRDLLLERGRVVELETRCTDLEERESRCVARCDALGAEMAALRAAVASGGHERPDGRGGE